MVAAVTRPAPAQARFGAQLGLSTDEYGIGLGIREWIPTAGRIAVIASANCVFRALRDNELDLNIDAAYRFSPQRAAVQPYLGGGLGLTHYPVTYQATAYALNLFGGTRFGQQAKAGPFLELRLIIAAGSSHVGPASRLTTTIGLLF